jgi:hypothetical protein
MRSMERKSSGSDVSNNSCNSSSDRRSPEQMRSDEMKANFHKNNLESRKLLSEAKVKDFNESIDKDEYDSYKKSGEFIDDVKTSIQRYNRLSFGDDLAVQATQIYAQIRESMNKHIKTYNKRIEALKSELDMHNTRIDKHNKALEEISKDLHKKYKVEPYDYKSELAPSLSEWPSLKDSGILE